LTSRECDPQNDTGATLNQHRLVHDSWEGEPLEDSLPGKMVESTETESCRTHKEFALDGRENAIRDEIAAPLAKEGGTWTLRAQLRRDAGANPVEDASIVWPEESNPYLPVATLTVKPQEGWSPERSHLVDDKKAFSPWHGIAALQPLGIIGRARRYIYPILSDYRGALNGCPIHELSAAPDLGDAQ
jgi:hypothetical protein